MSGDRLAIMAFLIVALTLPLSALLARRMPIGRMARLGAIWFVLIAGAALVVTLVRGGSLQ